MLAKHLENILADESEQPSFQHIMNFKQTPNVVQLQGPKQKYGFSMKYAKKALDLAVQTDKIDKFVDQVKSRIIQTTEKSDFYAYW
ncbi:hypothetical protein RhiirA4_487158 [Rhizophagus irregularis]|uniref:Uncharacterized protein n=1 Tax=Rhizophagus irregularis TaxID=588596 RepID=A0A2I1HS86_9GLOM|nr:hypothetical protein RhiirA4_487158 [Rhizophagus irregularis]